MDQLSKNSIWTNNRIRFNVKVLALLSLVRWYNILIIAIGLYLSSIFLLNPSFSKLELLTSPRLHLNVLSISLFIMAGYIINAFYDVEKDLINNPKQVIFDRWISKQFSFQCYFAFITLGLIISAFNGLTIFLAHLGFSFSLWFYSHKLRQIPAAGELGASLLTVFPFFSLCLFYDRFSWNILQYVVLLFAFVFIREIIKKLVAMKGDIVYGFKSIPIAYGEPATKILLGVLILLSLPLLWGLYYLSPDFKHLSYALVVGVLSVTAFALVATTQDAKRYDMANYIYKVILIGTVAFIGFI